MMPVSEMMAFEAIWQHMQKQAWKTAEEKGFHAAQSQEPQSRFIGHMMLLVCEVAEAVEAMRRGNPDSDHLPQYSAVAEELADCIIRIMDDAECLGVANLGEVITEKMRFNADRPKLHGKAF